MNDKKIQELENRIKLLESGSFGTDPKTHPQTINNLQQQINIPYTTTVPTYSPTLNGVRVIYFDGTHYWLYLWANAGWRKIQLT